MIFYGIVYYGSMGRMVVTLLLLLLINATVAIVVIRLDAVSTSDKKKEVTMDVLRRQRLISSCETCKTTHYLVGNATTSQKRMVEIVLDDESQ